eukprot:5909993-Pleurochrysis_carterae.AAC.2
MKVKRGRDDMPRAFTEQMKSSKEIFFLQSMDQLAANILNLGPLFHIYGTPTKTSLAKFKNGLADFMPRLEASGKRIQNNFPNARISKVGDGLGGTSRKRPTTSKTGMTPPEKKQPGATRKGSASSKKTLELDDAVDVDVEEDPFPPPPEPIPAPAAGTAATERAPAVVPSPPTASLSSDLLKGFNQLFTTALTPLAQHQAESESGMSSHACKSIIAHAVARCLNVSSVKSSLKELTDLQVEITKERAEVARNMSELKAQLDMRTEQVKQLEEDQKYMREVLAACWFEGRGQGDEEAVIKELVKEKSTWLNLYMCHANVDAQRYRTFAEALEIAQVGRGAPTALR